MDHPFVVGQYYENREGIYQVIDLQQDQMTIRYASGKTIRTPIALQERILENLQIEREVLEQSRHGAGQRVHGDRVRKASAEFTGFTLQDFGSLEGSTWRSQNALGGVLTNYLHSETGIPFRSWGVSRRLEMHIARPDKYDFYAPLPCAKLFVYSHEDLAFGFYIETPDRSGMADAPEKYKHWISFRNGLSQWNVMQSVLLEPMLNHNLTMTDYYNRDHTSSEFGGALQCEFQFRNGTLQWYRRSVPAWNPVPAQSMFERIARLPEEQWVDLHIYRIIPRVEAIAEGPRIIQPILEVLRSLIPLYQITVEQSTARPDQSLQNDRGLRPA